MAKTTISAQKTLDLGTSETEAYRVPSKVRGQFEVHLLMDQVDIEDKAKSIKLDVYISDDGERWRYLAGIVYEGGIYDPPGIPGFGLYDGKAIAGKYIKVVTLCSHRMNVGVEVETIDG